MGRAVIFIHGQTDRRKAALWVEKAPLGTSIEFKSKKRTVEQNSRMWGLLTEVSEQLEWFGQRYSPEDWKDYFMHALKRERRWMPAEEGGMVPIGLSTSSLTTDEHSELTTLIEAFGARQGVVFREPDRAPPIGEAA